jgi:GntR family transcriptional repressor for pyruvate dehydrogenase complex
MINAPIYRTVKPDRHCLSAQIAQQILDLIAAQQLRIGDRLPPLGELSGYLGVSRTSLREAVKLLDAWGILAVKHGVGTFVSKLEGDTLAVPFKVSIERSEESIRNLHQVREALEPATAALAAENARPEDIDKMEEAVRTMQHLLADLDEHVDEYIQADLAFHSALASASGNSLFLIVIYPVIDLLQEARRLSVENPGAAERAQAFHEMILKQVKAGNADGAKEAMRSHLDQTWWEIERQIDK